MVKLTGVVNKRQIVNPEYVESSRQGLGRFIFPITSFIRSINVERYIQAGKRLLDIGCGDGYFIKRSTYDERYGLDRLMGDEVTDTLDFPDSFFDCVTMIAVIEQMRSPNELLKEIHRVLRPGGRCIFTTPRKISKQIIRLYIKDLDDMVSSFLAYKDIKKMAADRFQIVGHHSFFFGLDQVFCLQKRD